MKNSMFLFMSILLVIVSLGCVQEGIEKQKPEETVKTVTTTTILGQVKFPLELELRSDRFTECCNGYEFKIDHLLHSKAGVMSGLVLDVKKPDGSSEMVEVSESGGFRGKVDDIEITLFRAEEKEGYILAKLSLEEIK